MRRRSVPAHPLRRRSSGAVRESVVRHRWGRRGAQPVVECPAGGSPAMAEFFVPSDIPSNCMLRPPGSTPGQQTVQKQPQHGGPRNGRNNGLAGKTRNGRKQPEGPLRLPKPKVAGSRPVVRIPTSPCKSPLSRLRPANEIGLEQRLEELSPLAVVHFHQRRVADDRLNAAAELGRSPLPEPTRDEIGPFSRSPAPGTRRVRTRNLTTDSKLDGLAPLVWGWGPWPSSCAKPADW